MEKCIGGKGKDILLGEKRIDPSMVWRKSESAEKGKVRFWRKRVTPEIFNGTSYGDGYMSIAPEITGKEKKIMGFKKVIHQLRRTIFRSKKDYTLIAPAILKLKNKLITY